jgi:hypothetical protein
MIDNLAYIGQDIVCRCRPLRWLWAFVLVVVGIPIAFVAQCVLVVIGAIAIAVKRRPARRYTYEELSRRSVN